MLKLHPSRVFAFFLIVFLVFVALFSIYPIYYDFSYLIVALFIVIFFFFNNKMILFLAILLLVPMVASQRLNHVNVHQELPQSGRSVFVQIVDEPKILGKSQSFSVDYGGGRFSIVTNQFPKYEFGEHLIVSGELKPLDASSEFFGYYMARNINASYYYPEIQRVEERVENYVEIRKALIGIRKKYEYVISRTLPEPQAGLLSGIVLGSRADLSERFSDLLAKTGVIHIVALSGYNITIIAAFMATVGKSFSKKYVFGFSIIGIWAFVLATGLSASVIRAAIMGTLLLIASRLGRRSSAFVSVLFASSLMVIVSPNILLYDIGFQLSFAAVCGILFLAPKLESFLKIQESFWGRMIIATFSAQIFTIPLLSWYFGRVSVISLVTNLLVLPFIPIVMLLGFLSSSVGLFSIWLSEKISIISWVILSYFVKLVEFLGSLKYAELDYSMGLLTMVAMYVILFELILILKKNGKREV